MSKGRGYLLPPPGEEVPELECCIIFYPNRHEYRRALMGALDYFGTWTAWERDDDKRGQLAAEVWRQANEETREAFEMGCFDALIDAINNINIQNQFDAGCFCEWIQTGDDEPDIPDINYQDGDPPADYGNSTVSDWDDWKGKVCFQADKYVDHICSQNNTLETAVSVSVVTVALIAAVLGALATGGLLIPVAWSLAVTVVGGLISGSAAAVFDDVCDDVNAHRQEIKDAIVCGGDLGQAIQDSVSTEAWSLFYQFVNWNQAAAAIRAGRANSQLFAGDGTSEDCSGDCYDLGPFVVWDTDNELMEYEKNPPACDRWSGVFRQGLYIEEYEQWSGDVEVSGYIKIDGDMVEHANCAGAMELEVEARICATSDEDWPSCDTTDVPLYFSDTYPSGSLSEEIPFTLSKTGLVNQKVLAIRATTSVRAGTVDINCEVVITSASLTEP